jgi:DNA invertase Pin-like site-specific DNA recombinase
MKVGYIGRLPEPDNSNLIDQRSELEKYNCDRYEQEKEGSSSIEDTLLLEVINNLNKGDEILVCAFKYIARDKASLKKVLRQVEIMKGSITVTELDMTPSSLLQAYDEFNSYVHSYRIRNSDTPKQTEWQKNIRSMARSRLEQRDVNTKKYDEDVKKIINLITEDAGIKKRSAGRPKEVLGNSIPQIRNDLADGLSVKNIAKNLGVSTRTIYRVIKQNSLKRGDKK